MDINIETSLKEYGFYGIETDNHLVIAYGVAIDENYNYIAFESFEDTKENCKQYIADIGKKRLRDVYSCCGVSYKDSLLSKLEAIRDYFGNDFMFNITYATINFDEARALFE